MKTHVLLVLMLCSVFLTAQSQTQPEARHSRIALMEPDVSAIKAVLHLGIDLRCGNQVSIVNGIRVLQFECSQDEIAALRESGLQPDIVIDDVGAFYAQRSEMHMERAMDELRSLQAGGEPRSDFSTTCSVPERPVPLHFELGEMGGFLYYQQILDMLDSMSVNYPDLITVKRPLSDTLHTFEGRPVFWVKISDHPNANEAEPEVLYTALTHAREPASAMTLLYYMWYLLENYSTDPEIQRIVDFTEMYFVPVVNPDGYVLNETNSPDGGGMWRKNLHDNDHNAIIDDNDGVDLNRNFGHLWGLDDYGSSPKPTYSTYRGESPFSEPETRMLREFVLQREFVSAMHDHSYGTDLYYPWDHGEEILPDSSSFYRISDLMSWNNRYHFGQSYSTYWLGAINGGANDWFYGDQTSKPKIFSWIPEIGSAFWPDPVEIVTLCMEQMDPHLMLAKSALQNAMIHDLNPPSITHGMNTLVFRVENLGQRAGDFSTSLVQIGDFIKDFSIQDDGRTHFDEILESSEIIVYIDVDTQAPDGSEIAFELLLEAQDYPVSKVRISKVIDPVLALQDNPELNDLGIWESEFWGVTIDSKQTNIKCLTDSPGSSQLNEYNTITLKEGIDLSAVSWARLTFLAHWSIETQHDYVQLQARANDQPWRPLCGKYSKPGASGYNIAIPSPYAGQPLGEPIYDGRQKAWISEDVDLVDYVGLDNIELRFVAWSGGLVSPIEEDGFYFAELKIYTSRKVHCANQILDEGEEGVDCGGVDCAPCATCDDGIMNGDEGAVDCGGTICAPCPSCTDGIQNSDEEGIDCGGGSCAPCPTCTDGIQNNDEEGIDCGGGSCAPCPTCTDGIQNSDEEDIDCGGAACAPCATCSDGIQNGSETGTDCGGDLCAPCEPTCTDHIMNGDEEGVDCGGHCPYVCKTLCCENDNRIWYADTALMIKLLPNPVQNQLLIMAEWLEQTESQDIPVLRWNILDYSGMTDNKGEFSGNGQWSIDVSGLIPHMYLLRISDPLGSVVVQRFLKQD